MQSHNQSNNEKGVDLNRTKRNMVIITMNKKECIDAGPNTVTANTSFCHNEGKYDLTYNRSSGVVVLLISRQKMNTEVLREDRDDSRIV